jgi:hypothetical protein
MKKILFVIFALLSLGFVMPEAARAGGCGPRVAVSVGVPFPPVPVVVPARRFYYGYRGPYYRRPVRVFYRGARFYPRVRVYGRRWYR